MSARMVDARFAGCTIKVDIVDANGLQVVQVDMPTNSTGMHPDEARRLAVTLIEQAAHAEQPVEDIWP